MFWNSREHVSERNPFVKNHQFTEYISGHNLFF